MWLAPADNRLIMGKRNAEGKVTASLAEVGSTVVENLKFVGLLVPPMPQPEHHPGRHISNLIICFEGDECGVLLRVA